MASMWYRLQLKGTSWVCNYTNLCQKTLDLYFLHISLGKRGQATELFFFCAIQIASNMIIHAVSVN